jgi:uncharacterized protein with HEPN domain
MSRHDPALARQQMLDHAREAIEMVRGRDRCDLDSDRQLNLALTRLLEIIGEAAGRVPQAEWSLYPSVPWYEIVGLRNRLVHGYDSVDLGILWQTVLEDLPPLILALESGLSETSQ